MEQNPIIEAQRAKVAQQRAELQISEAELRGMELVHASYTPGPAVAASLKRSAAPSRTHNAEDGPKAGGKPKGSISMNWRAVLGTFYAVDAPFSPAEVVAREHLMHGRMLNQRAVRRLFEGYIEHGYIEADGDLYRVTEVAAERFGLKRAELGDQDANAAEGASESQPAAASVYSSQEGGDGHAANNTNLAS